MKSINIKTLSDKELSEMMDLLDAELARRTGASRVLEIRNLNINGITTKDFVVEYADYEAEFPRPDRPTYSFYIKRGKKLHCIYYGFNNQSWWPTGDARENAASEFIPHYFVEASENSYEFDGAPEIAIECLKQHGFTTIKNVQKRVDREE